MSAEQEARTFVPGNADQQLCVVGVDDVGGENAVVGGFLAQLVRLASEHPHQRVEPEQGGGDPGEQQLDPVHAGNVGKLVGDYRFGFARRFHRATVEKDDRADQTPTDRRSKFVAGEQCGAMLETHAPLRAGERA